MKNEFKNNTEPKKLSEVKKLNPPQFAYEPVTIHNPNIFWGQALIRAELRGIKY